MAVSDAETGFTLYPAKLIAGLKKANLLTSETEEEFMSSWRRWVAEREAQKPAIDLRALVTSIPAQDLPALLLLAAKRITKRGAR